MTSSAVLVAAPKSYSNLLMTFTSADQVLNTTNRFRKDFPQPINMTGWRIGLQSISCFNCTFNIRADYANNQFTLYFPNNIVSSTQPLPYGVYNFTFPDSYMAASDMNAFLQQQCILNNLYAITSTGKYVYFIELVQNTPYYAIQLNTYTIPTQDIANKLGYIQCPNATWTWSQTTPVSPSVTFCQPFGDLIGFKSVDDYGNPIYFPAILPSPTTPTYFSVPITPAAVSSTGGMSINSKSMAVSTVTTPQFSTTNKQFLSTKTPELSVVNSYVLTSNVANNRLSNPQDVFCSIPLSKGLGQMVTLEPGRPAMVNCVSSVCSSIEVVFKDQNLNDLNGKFLDPSLVIGVILEIPNA